MHSSLPYKTKQFFFVLIKLSIVVGAFYFIYHKLTSTDSLDVNGFFQFLKDNKVFSIKNSVLLVFLSSLNWFIEIIKWRFLVSKLKALTFFEALEQSLGSLTASLFTPNRIGEYGAKAIYYSKPYRKRILLTNLIGNLMQMTITVVLGGIGFAFYYKTYPISIDFFKISRGILIILSVAILSIIGIKKTKYKIKGFSIKKIKDYLATLGTNYITLGLCLSFLRYVVFSFQFYYILILFGITLSYPESMVIITSLYLLASIIPTISIFDVVIKGSLAIYLFGAANVTELPVLSCILLMWLLNFALPSVFGSYYVLNFNLSKLNS